MSWQETVLVALGMANTIAAAGSAVWILRRRPSAGARTLAVAVFTLTGWCLTETASWLSQSPEAKMFFTKASLLPAVTAPVALLAFVLRLGDPPKRLSRRQVVLLALEPAITVLLGWTNAWHGWMWRAVAPDDMVLLSQLRLTHGPWFWFHSLYTYALLIVAALALLRRAQRTSGLRRQQALALLLAGLAAWLGHLLAWAFPQAGAFSITAGITVANSLLLWNLYSLRLFDIVPLARAAIMDQMEDCVIVLDPSNRIVDLNAAAERLMGKTARQVIGLPPQEVFRDYGQHMARWGHRGELRDELRWERDGTPLWHEVHITPLSHFDGSPAGNLVTLHDITERKQLEAEDQQRRLFLEHLLSAAPDAIVALDSQHRVVEWSGGAERLFGYSAAEAVGHDLDDLVAQPDQDCYKEARAFTAQVLSGEAFGPTEVQRYRKDGTAVQAVVAGSPMHVGDELIGVVGVYTDISPLKQAEEAVIQSEARYRAVIQDQTELISRFLPDGTMTFVNEATSRFLGRSREELVGTSYAADVPAEDAQRVAESLRSLTPDQPLVTLENRVTAADGDTRWLQWTNRGIFDHAGRLVEVQSVGRDITEHRLAQDALREAESRYRTLVETSPDSIALLSLEGRILFSNLQTAVLHGYSRPEEMTGISLPELLVPENRERAWDALRRALARGSVHSVACTLLRRDGSAFPADLSVSVVRDAALRPTGYIAVTRDVSARQRAEEQLQESLRQKDMLLSEIHHRVKSNLQIVSSLLYLQALDAVDAPTARILEDSRRRVHSMALVHEKLYASGDLANIDMRPYVNDLAASLALHREGSNAAVEVVADIEDVTMPVDSAIPCGLLINELVSNALEHSFADDQGGQIRLALRKSQEGFMLEVADNGAGARSAVDAGVPPTLGLQLINMLVEQLHGTLIAETAEGNRVSILFPAVEAALEEPMA